jgi:hypothetical protein
VVSFTPRPLYPRGNRPLDRTLGWAPEPVWTLWGRERSCPAGNRTRAVQPVARRYTDWGVPASVFPIGYLIFSACYDISIAGFIFLLRHSINFIETACNVLFKWSWWFNNVYVQQWLVWRRAAMKPVMIFFWMWDISVIEKGKLYLWDLTSCGSLKAGVTCSLHPTCFYTGFMLDLFIDPEDGGDIILRNVSWISTDYMTVYPIR